MGNTECVMGERTKKTLQALCLTLKDVARAVGMSHDSLRGWSAGRTEPSPDNRAALAAFMRTHAARLVKLAEELES